MKTEKKITNLLDQLAPNTFIDLCKKRVIPFHCELGTPMVEFIDHINGDEGELIIDVFVSQGLDSRYNVLNYPILENAMRNVDLTTMSDLRDLYEYCYSTIQNYNESVSLNHKKNIQKNEHDSFSLYSESHLVPYAISKIDIPLQNAIQNYINSNP